VSSFPGSPKLLKGGIVLLDPQSSAVRRVIALQYNPDSLTRTLQPQAVAAEGGDRSEALRLKGPPVETIRLEAELDAADAMERGDATVAQYGLFPALAALETIVYPDSARLVSNNALAAGGSLEIVPVEAPLSLFVWSKNRIAPVRITELSITEEAFDPNLNPIRAKVSLSLRVLSVTDLGFASKGGGLFLVYQQQKERLADLAASRNLAALGLGGIP
jgi:hypothetical protein